jgi:Raf kinase inhibitor-like YbhB/YbcL family protein
MSLTVTTTAFAPGGEIAKKHTCDGADASPALSWTGAPAAAKEIAVICDDPDAPGGTFVHWVAWGIPAARTGLAEGARDAEMKLGVNGFGTRGYRGPCPPRGKPHRYVFKVFALDAPPKLSPGASADDLTTAMKGHVLAQGELVGKYGR